MATWNTTQGTTENYVVPTSWWSGEEFPNSVTIPENAYPRQGLASWAQPTAQNLLGSFGDVGKTMRGAYDALSGAPGLIEQQRQQMYNNYWADVPTMMNKNVNEALNALGQRGVLSSSVMQNTLSNIADQISQGAIKAENEANTWSGNALMQNLQDRFKAASDLATAQRGVLGLGTESVDPSKLWALALGMMTA